MRWTCFSFLLLPLYLVAADFPHITSSEQLQELFPSTVTEVETLKAKATADFLADLQEIVAIPKEKRTFENTLQALDLAMEKISVAHALICSQSFVSPNPEIQEVARKAQDEINQMLIEQFTENRHLYYAVKDFADKEEKLMPYQQYYLDELMKSFEEQGHLLPADERKEVKNLLQEIVKLEETFEQNIQADESYLDVEKSQLAGLSDDFIQSHQLAEGEKYRLSCDYPTYFTVIDYCQNPETRKAFYRIFQNRAYPKNEAILVELIEKRNAYARKLGYPSYSHLSLRKEMAISPKTVEKFLSDLSSQLAQKEKQELEELQKVPFYFSMQNEKGQIYPWDYRFLENAYLKDHFFLDHQQVAEYFPLPVVMKGMCDVFGQFFDVTIAIETPAKLWSDDLISLKITDNKDQKLLGFIVMDLFPRPNKYSHACMMKILPSRKGDVSSVKMIIANFPKPQGDKPSLMPLDQVRTLFHEFGHAMHGILGKAEMYGQSGTNVKTDFVELPSQLLEEWAWEKEVLKQISSHYKTEEPIPDVMIEKILSSRYATAGFFYRRQACLSFLSLYYFSGDAITSSQDLHLKMLETHRPLIASDSESHFPCNFGHLSGYGAKYYGYLWTRLMAADVFAEIKKRGMGKDIGAKYRATILEKGGSEHPKHLMKDFLGREPTQEAFLKSIISKSGASIAEATEK